MQVLPLNQDTSGPNHIQTGPGEYYPFCEISQDAYYEVTYSGFLVQTESWYDDNTKAVLLRRVSYTYSGFQVSTLVWQEYRDGSIWSTVTDSYTYSGFQLSSFERVQT